MIFSFCSYKYVSRYWFGIYFFFSPHQCPCNNWDHRQKVEAFFGIMERFIDAELKKPQKQTSILLSLDTICDFPYKSV